MLDTAVHGVYKCLIFELCGMTLWDLLCKDEFFPLPTWQIQQIVFQIVECIARKHLPIKDPNPCWKSLQSDLHRIGITHADLKLDNIILCDDGHTFMAHMVANCQFEDRVSIICNSLRVLINWLWQKILRSPEICIIDFSSAFTTSRPPMHCECGTNQYRAPETCLGKPGSGVRGRHSNKQWHGPQVFHVVPYRRVRSRNHDCRAFCWS